LSPQKASYQTLHYSGDYSHTTTWLLDLRRAQVVLGAKQVTSRGEPVLLPSEVPHSRRNSASSKVMVRGDNGARNGYNGATALNLRGEEQVSPLRLLYSTSTDGMQAVKTDMKSNEKFSKMRYRKTIALLKASHHNP
jgi:hypothetical protein